jgi:hypothetical protein
MLKTLKPKLLLLREEIEAQVKSRLPRAAKHRPYQLAPKADCSAAQQGIAIVAIIKDEAPYLAEWLEFHLMLGVRHILGEAYARFFYSFEGSPLLIVNAASIDPINRESDYQELLRTILSVKHGRQFFNPAASALG